MSANPIWKDKFHPLARQILGRGGTYWLGGLTRHKGHPFAADCGHKHRTRAEAADCAESLLHADADSPLGEKLNAII